MKHTQAPSYDDFVDGPQGSGTPTQHTSEQEVNREEARKITTILASKECEIRKMGFPSLLLELIEDEIVSLLSQKEKEVRADQRRKDWEEWGVCIASTEAAFHGEGLLEGEEIVVGNALAELVRRARSKGLIE